VTARILESMRADARDWARGRNPWVRLPLLVFTTWIFIHHLRDSDYTSIIGGLNLGIHELGHFVFGPFGDFLAAAGGTVLQCFVPIAGAVMFWKQRDWFAVTFAFAWLATNFYAIAPYAADARTRELPLVSPGSGDPIHDWYFMLSSLRWLRYDHFIGALFRLAGTLTMLAAITAGAWLLWSMRTPGPIPGFRQSK
jgi:hypothetical protein